MRIDRFAMVSVLLLSVGCSFSDNSKLQNELHAKLHSYIEKALNETASEVKNSADILESCMNRAETCKPGLLAPNNMLSSTFVPSFSKEGAPLVSFLKASQKLEERWDAFLKKHTFISWIYSFDDTSGALRISPATATDMTYGRKMDFRKFEFYESAKSKLPEIVWQDKPKEDVSGTGSILIVSTARKVSAGTAVVSADVKVSSLERGTHSTLNQVVVQRKLKSLLFFSYIKPETGLRSLIAEYATDQSQWLSLRSFPNLGSSILRVPAEEQNTLLVIEKKVEESPKSHVQVENVMLAESSYTCSVSRIDSPRVLLWLCIR